MKVQEEVIYMNFCHTWNRLIKSIKKVRFVTHQGCFFVEFSIFLFQTFDLLLEEVDANVAKLEGWRLLRHVAGVDLEISCTKEHLKIEKYFWLKLLSYFVSHSLYFSFISQKWFWWSRWNWISYITNQNCK